MNFVKQGPFDVVIKIIEICCVDAIVYRTTENKGVKSKEWMYDVVLDSGERVTIDGFTTFKDAKEDRINLLEGGLEIDMEDDEEEEVKVVGRKTIQGDWELDKENITKEAEIVLLEGPKEPLPEE